MNIHSSLAPRQRAPRRLGHARRRLLALLLVCASATVGHTQPRAAPEHPRIFLRTNDIPNLQQRCRSNPELAKTYESLRKFAYGSAKHANLWIAPDQLSSILVVYLVENRDPKLLRRARDFLNDFLQAEGDEWTRPRLLKAVAQAYDWLHADLSENERRLLAERIISLAGQIRRQYRHSDYNNHVYLQHGTLVYAGLALAGDGLNDPFASEILTEARELLTRHFIPAVNQLGENGQGGWPEGMSYWSFFAYEFAHQLEAWRTGTGEDLFRTCPGLGGAALWLTYGTRPHDQSFAPVADINTPVRADWQELACLPLLAQRYRDGLAQYLSPQITPDKVSHVWPFILWYDPSIQSLSPSSLPLGTLFPGVGWAAMRSSWDASAVWALFVCGDYFAGHQHADQNSFIIGCRGDLATDAGEYGAKETVFHNTVLLGAGQRVYATDPRLHAAATVPHSEFDTGDILAFEENQHFTYVLGDASNAYGQFQNQQRLAPAPLFLRRFIFLKPDTFVVDDQIRCAPEDRPVRWLLHAQQKPVVKNRTVRISQGDGELLCQTLQPLDAVLTNSTIIGGNGPRALHFVEVVPAAEPNEMRFLHVLQARARVTSEPAVQSHCVETNGGLLLTISGPQRTYRLLLPPPSQGPGGISVRDRKGQVLLAPRPLPAGVLPYKPAALSQLARWNAAYQNDARAPWDTGRPSSELQKIVAAGILAPGRVLELGCGSGHNALYLARQGFDVTAIDLAPSALGLAERQAAQAGLPVHWLLADVLAPPDLEPFQVIFDRGCYHGVRQQHADAYVASLLRLSRPGTRILILAGNANEPPPHSGPPRVTEAELRRDFGASFDFEDLHPFRFDTVNPNEPGALAWSVLLRRK